MANEVLMEDQNLRVEYSVTGNYLLLLWGERTPAEYFQDRFSKIIGICESRKISGLFIDTVRNKGISPASQEYAARKVEEYAKKRDSFKQAMLVPPDIFSKFSVDSYSKKVSEYASNVETRFFEDNRAALSWLEEAK
ncbi:MAG: hypothetical protein JXJ22_03110 [Bacteroidales bacterium]|nr:hypothetical protein [Bacteroidales bacterium]